MHRSCRHQTWSASGYLSLIYYELLGAKIQKDKVTFSPYLPSGVNEATINGFKVGNATFDILITKDGAKGSTTVDTSAEGHYTLHLGA